MKKKPLILFFILVFTMYTTSYSQKVSLTNNLLYDLTTTPNIGIDVYLSQKTSFSVSGSYNPFKFSGKTFNNSFGEEVNTNTKVMHWGVMPEYKYWFCKTFEKSYIGLHGIYTEYNMSGIAFVPFLKNNRYEGIAYGGGFSCGYQWALGDRWGIEASLGGGLLLIEYDKYDLGECGDHLGKFKRTYWGVTKASLSLIYFIK